jgi:hypothetical protein
MDMRIPPRSSREGAREGDRGEQVGERSARAEKRQKAFSERSESTRPGVP